MCLCDWWTKLLRSVQKQNNKKNPTTSFLWYSCVCCYDDILMQNHTNPTEIMYDLLLYALDCTLCVIYCLPLHQIFVWCNSATSDLLKWILFKLYQVSLLRTERGKKRKKRVKKKEFCTVARQKKWIQNKWNIVLFSVWIHNDCVGTLLRFAKINIISSSQAWQTVNVLICIFPSKFSDIL